MDKEKQPAEPGAPVTDASTPVTDATASTAAAPAAPADTPKLEKASRPALAVMGLVALAGVVLILWAWQLGPFSTAVVQTDNAYVRGQITVLAPQVNGHVTQVAVRDFEHVSAGQVLVRIDDRIYREKVMLAEAQVDSAHAQLTNSDQTQAQNRASLGARRATLAAAQAEANRAYADRARTDELASRGALAIRERDQARATAELAHANVLKAQADIAIGEQTITSTKVAREGLLAQVKAAQAQLELARIDLANTRILAPRDGQVSEATVRPGQYVAAGSQLMFLVPPTLWVVANFKETQTANMHIGQRASFEVDALQGARLWGRIEEIAPATGSEFSVLRADNATGNFTKVVQRLPVRIAIDADQALAARLRPGMSVIAHVDTGTAASTESAPSAAASRAAAPR